MSHQNMICLKVIYFCFHTFQWNSNHPLKTGTKNTGKMTTWPTAKQKPAGSWCKILCSIWFRPPEGKNRNNWSSYFRPPVTKTQKHHGFFVRPSYGFSMALLRETQWFFHKPWSWGRLPLGGYVRWRESWLRLVIERNGFLFIDFSKWLGGGWICETDLIYWWWIFE